MRDQSKINRLKDRGYRHAYVDEHVRGMIAMQIRALRKKLGLNQKAFSKLIGTTQSVVSRLENTEYGKVTVQTLLDIAAALDVALNIRFTSFPEFIRAYGDLSEAALAVTTFDETVWDAPAATLEVSQIEPVESTSGPKVGSVIQGSTGDVKWQITIRQSTRTASLRVQGTVSSEMSTQIQQHSALVPTI